jgi:hypothetical protein
MFSRRSTKAQVARSITFALGTDALKAKSKSSRGGGLLEAGAADALLELLAVPALDLVRQQPVHELAVAEVIVDGLAGAQFE